MTKTLIIIIYALSLYFGCFTNGHANDATIEKRANEAKLVSQKLVSNLGKRLKSELAENGPDAAISVCRNIAPQMANKISLENGWRVTRISHKPRNTLMGLPDSWEQKVLNNFASRLEGGEGYETMEHFEVIDEPQGKSFRYVMALETKGICLACHGSKEQISPEVRASLESIYPFDRAQGFKLGEMRGAVSIKQPLN